jgi:hypothetical protein
VTISEDDKALWQLFHTLWGEAQECNYNKQHWIALQQAIENKIHILSPERAGLPATQRFHAILKELGELHDRKQRDYGTDQDPLANVRASTEWGIPAWVGTLVRLNDKVRRLQAFARKGSLANESAIDSLRDIAVYAIIALILYEEVGCMKEKDAR